MQARFLLGPAGSGKTFRCLEEVRAELRASPAGAPLVLLAPKQATFQLERQLLAAGDLPGYTRLQILSFDRLAGFILQEFAAPPPQLLAEEGRLMVLRALLGRKQGELKLFRSTARLPGFTRQLSLLLRELQRHQLSPDQLSRLAEKTAASPLLAEKLRDFALLLTAYLDWLKEHRLEDANCLLELAREEMRRAAASPTPISQLPSPKPVFRLGGLWLDGFAEMTPQELDLLATLLPWCEHATLAFCLDFPAAKETAWLSPWAVVGQTFRQCHQRLAALPGVEVQIETMERVPGKNRFTTSPALAHLERHWPEPQPFAGAISDTSSAPPLRLVTCANPAAEAAFAAREVWRFVRAGGRFRDVAVLVRSLEDHHVPLRRTFTRYGIPFFLDQREPVAHHPLAELTRSALRLATFGWRSDDWFAALKSGLVKAGESEIDRLENAALEFGWEGDAWLKPLSGEINPDAIVPLEKLRRQLVPPFQQLAGALAGGSPTGPQLAAGLRTFWEALAVAETLEAWGGTEFSPEPAGVPSSVHATVWRQMHEWLDNVERAFARDALPLRDWLPILEAGLGSLTVGVIPPALDQVLIGTIDRSRNPDLRLALVLGLNESIFPATPAAPLLLTETDRATLEQQNIFLGPATRQRLAHERYYGYIACTRARERLVLTRATSNAGGGPLNPSSFIAHLGRLFPNLTEEQFSAPADWRDSEHASELITPLIRGAGPEPLENSPTLAALSARVKRLRDFRPDESLSPALVESLHGPVLQTSVSKLEQFAACPFRFFVNAGLRAEERKFFELDARQLGSFQHEVLAAFHQELSAEQKRWRDLTPAGARARIQKLAAQAAPGYRGGLFQASAQNRFTTRSLTEALQNFISAAVAWMTSYDFDPTAVELGFGQPDDPLPAWELDLGEGHRLAFRGKIDRVDLCPGPNPGEALCVVLDYKSSARQLDPVLLAHGVQLQLPAYLGALRHSRAAAKHLGVERLIPAGVFYVNLRGQYKSAGSRAEALPHAGLARQQAYQHAGRFDLEFLPRLDARFADGGSGQFRYKLKKDGQPNAGSRDVMTPAGFNQLLATVEQQLIRMGREIFAGAARVDPYQKGSQLACDQCECRAVCRIDPWTHSWRVLRAGQDAGDA